MTAIEMIFGKPKAIIAMAHFPPLPGQPLYDSERGLAGIRERVRADVEALLEAGVDGVLFCNEGDRPYSTQAGAETVAVMAAVIGELVHVLDRPFGVDVLWDPKAAIAIAKATGASFVREVFTGVYAGDFGLWNTDPAAALRYRRMISADGVRCFFNICAEFAAPVEPRALPLLARSAVFSSLADGICVSGNLTGSAPEVENVAQVKRAVPETAVIANTGVRPETVADFLDVADAVIVGTALKRGGVTWNEVDRTRVLTFMTAAAASGLWSPRQMAVAHA